MKAVERWLGWLSEDLAILAVLFAACVCCPGCIWLAVPSLAYEGYKYEHQLNTPSSPDSSGDASNSQPASRNRASSDHSIE